MGARDRNGALIARAPVVVLANAADALRLAAPARLAAYPIRHVRGQQTMFRRPLLRPGGRRRRRLRAAGEPWNRGDRRDLRPRPRRHGDRRASHALNSIAPGACCWQHRRRDMAHVGGVGIRQARDRMPTSARWSIFPPRAPTPTR
jgi:hypothetical protein